MAMLPKEAKRREKGTGIDRIDIDIESTLDTKHVGLQDRIGHRHDDSNRIGRPVRWIQGLLKHWGLTSFPHMDKCARARMSLESQCDRSIGDVARTWSRIVGTPSEKIVDRSKDDLIQMKISIIVFVCIASIVYF